MEHDLKCPKCNEDLVQDKIDDLIVWYCPKCSREE